MNFDFTPEEEAFRKELRAFIEENLPEWWQGMFLEQDKSWTFTRRFCEMLAEKGWLTMAWPVEYGGQAASPWKQTVLREEMWSHQEPRGPQYMSLNWIGPTIMKFGTDAQKAHFLPRMAAGKLNWCQGFSEPNAGSDLASLQTRADEDGDDYVINGQKIWTSYAQQADYCFLATRTDAEVPKHRGISVFLVDMKTPGIKIRPIDSLVGYGDINQVYFDDVRVPRTAMLGEKNRGWYVMASGLNHERVGVARYAKSEHLLHLIIDYCKQTVVDGRRLADDPVIRQKIADAYVAWKAARLMNYRVVHMQAAGLEPSTEASLARLHSIPLEQKIANLGLEILGLYGQLNPGAPQAPARGTIQWLWRQSVSSSIAAGTLEIQKNLVAQRGLGLPR
jgi:alkylation response protein AidB-like acyl-CoA dehydrogenase